MTDKELRQQNNAKIQSGTTGMSVSSLLRMAEGNPGFKATVAQDEVVVERTHFVPSPLQMEIRSAMLNEQQIAEKVYGDGSGSMESLSSFYQGFERMHQSIGVPNAVSIGNEK